MNLGTRKNLSFALGMAGAALLFVAQFVWNSSWQLIVTLLGSGALLLLIAAAIDPPFWWGIRSFTTPINDPSHERRQDET